MNETPSPRPVTAACVIVLVGALSAASLWGRPSGVALWLDIGFAVLSLVAAAVQLWWPIPGAIAATVLAAVSPAATPAATMGALQVAQRNRFAVAAAVAAGGFGAHLVRGAWRPSSGISLGWWLLLVFACYGALLGWGAQARSRRALLVSLHDRAVRAEAEQGRRVAEARMAERRTLAREMHDVLAHRLTLVATHAGALEYRPDASPELLTRAAGVVRAGVHQALEELRDVIGLLREDDTTDITAPQPTLTDLPHLITEAREAGQEVELRDELNLALHDNIPTAPNRDVPALTNERDAASSHASVTPSPKDDVTPSPKDDVAASLKDGVASSVCDAVGVSARGDVAASRRDGAGAGAQGGVGDVSGLPGAVGRTAYRVVQEGLTNARKHASGQQVEVRLHGAPGARLHIEISNPLPATGAVSAVPGSGVGLVGLTERVRLAGGQLDHQVSDGRFVLRAWLAWPA